MAYVTKITRFICKSIYLTVYLLERFLCSASAAAYMLWRRSRLRPALSLQGSLRSRLRRFKEAIGVGRCWAGWCWLAVSTDSLQPKTKHYAKAPRV